MSAAHNLFKGHFATAPLYYYPGKNEETAWVRNFKIQAASFKYCS
jgi:hypothetical protein